MIFEHSDRSRHRHRSIRRRKNDVRFLYRNVRRASKKLFGPRKPQCVDFSRQTYSGRYGVFDRFRSVSRTAIDRGIGIGRIGVEKTTFDFCREMYGAPAKKCSGPENRDASILVGKHIANAMIFSTVFDRFRAPRSIEASASIDRGIGIDRFGVEKTTFDFCTEMYGAPAKNCSGPENRDASISFGRHTLILEKNATHY